jgi:hypothetical protein
MNGSISKKGKTGRKTAKKTVKTKTVKTKTVQTAKIKSLRRFGMNNESELIKSLNSDRNDNIVDWVCNNLNHSVNNTKNKIKSRGIKYTVFNIRKINAITPSIVGKKPNLKKNIFVICSDNFIGSGSWGKVYDAFIFDNKFYENPKNKVFEKAKLNKKLKVNGFNVVIKNTSQAFFLLLKYEYLYIDTILKTQKDSYAIKVPKTMELDGDSLKDILFEPAIHGAICLNKNTAQYVPELKTIFLQPINNTKWKTKCQHLIKNKNENKEIPNSKIISVMGKLDGSFDKILSKRSEMQLSELDLRIPDDNILSYLLQISNALIALYDSGIEFNHRDFKPDNTMFKKVNIATQISINSPDMKFKFPSYGELHKIIDFGLSCLKYKSYQLNTVSYYDKNSRCFSQSRDLTQLVFIILNFHWNILNDKIIGYLGYLLDINQDCNLWRNLVDTEGGIESEDEDEDEDEYEYTDESEDEYNENNINSDNFNSNENNEYNSGDNNDVDEVEDNNENNDEIHFNEKCSKIKSWDTRLYNFLNRIDYDNSKLYPIQIIQDIFNYSKTGNLPQSEEAILLYKKYREDSNL